MATNGFDAYHQWLGIAPKDQPPNHYRLLGVDLFESDPDVIESATDRQMAHVRLFQNGPHGDVSQKLLNEITTAKLCLLSTAKKADYDAKLQAEKEAAEAAARPKARAVRGRPLSKAEPSTPAETDLGPPMPRPPSMNGSAEPAEPDDLVDPSEIELLPPADASPLSDTLATFFGNSASAERLMRGRESRRRQAALAGGVLGLVVIAVIGLFVAKRNGWIMAERPPASQPRGDPDVQIPAPENTPSKSSEEKTPPTQPDIKPPPAKTPPEPAKKTGPTTNGTEKDPEPATPKDPPGGTPVLRLTGRDYAELTDTPYLGSARDLASTTGSSLTAEMWAKLDPAEPKTYLMGNLADGGVHPDVPRGESRGWVLAYVGRSATESGLMLQIAGKSYLAPKSELDDGRHHVALCMEPAASGVEYRVYLDGNKMLFVTMPAEAHGNSPADLCLGRPRYLRKGEDVQTNLSLYGFRLSGAARYSNSFKPSSLARDQQTFAALDFSAGKGAVLTDASGKHHEGRIIGGQWIAADGAITAAGNKTGGDGSPRLAVPTGTDLEQAQQQVQGQIPADFAAALPPVKLALARKFLKRAEGSEDSEGVRYALLVEAREIAIPLVDVELAVEANAKLGGTFAIDRAAQALEMLGRLSAANVPVDKRKTLVDALAEATEDAVTNEQLTKSVELAELTFKTAGKFREQLRRVTALRDRATQLRSWEAEAEEAKKTLIEKPDDPAANAAVGLYLFFVRGEWESGLPHLAKSSSAKLKSAAQLESVEAATADQQAAIGDAWWDAAAAASGVARILFQQRAAHWYEQAVAELKGPAKTAVEKRLAALEKATAELVGDVGAADLAKRIVGEFSLTATAQRTGAKSSTTLTFAKDGTLAEKQSTVGKWAIQSGQVHVTYGTISEGTAQLRSRDKDTFVGQQTLGNGDTLNWLLRRMTGNGASARAIYLDDGPETEFKVWANAVLGKHGAFGLNNERVVFERRPVAHALGMHPPPDGPSYVVYNLRGQYATFRATAAILMFGAEGQADSPLTFKVLGDGKLLWQSDPLQRLGAGQACTVSIRGVKTLRLEVHHGGSYGSAHAAWLMPAVSKSP